MISEVDIQDMNPNYDLTPEEIVSEDKAYFINMELEALSIEMGWGSLYPDKNNRFYD